MHWNNITPAVKTSKINFYYQPSMGEIASMLVSSPGSFDFSYVKQTNSETQYELLRHFEEVHDIYPEARKQIDEFISEIEFGIQAKCQFIIQCANYCRFPTLQVDKVSHAHDLVKLKADYHMFRSEIDIILSRVLTATGQGSRIKAAVQTRPELTGMFEKNIPYLIDNMDSDIDPVVVARNISNTQASISRDHYNKLESYLMIAVLSDDMSVKLRTAKSHMSKIGVKDV